jgi:hypothetical protein
VWLAEREMRLLTSEERWELAADRRDAAVRDYARQHSLSVDAARLTLWPPIKSATRTGAMAESERREAEPGHEPCETERAARTAYVREHGWRAQRERLLRGGPS